MAANSPTPPRPTVRLNKSGAVTLYSNNVQLEVSPFDFRLRFRRFAETTVEFVDIDELAVVYLTPTQAKALAAVLRRQITKFEKDHGPIEDIGAAKDTDESALAKLREVEVQIGEP